MARKSSKPPEGETPPAPDTITKAEAIRNALAEGLTKYEDAAPFIKMHFGHDITPGHFASAKSREKPPGVPAAKRGRPPGKSKTVEVTVERGSKLKATSTPAAQPRPANGAADLLAEMEALKPLVESMGKEKAHRIIDLLG